jgi:hypothetical protein
MVMSGTIDRDFDLHKQTTGIQLASTRMHVRIALQGRIHRGWQMPVIGHPPANHGLWSPAAK